MKTFANILIASDLLAKVSAMFLEPNEGTVLPGVRVLRIGQGVVKVGPFEEPESQYLLSMSQWSAVKEYCGRSTLENKIENKWSTLENKIEEVIDAAVVYEAWRTPVNAAWKTSTDAMTRDGATRACEEAKRVGEEAAEYKQKAGPALVALNQFLFKRFNSNTDEQSLKNAFAEAWPGLDLAAFRAIWEKRMPVDAVSMVVDDILLKQRDIVTKFIGGAIDESAFDEYEQSVRDVLQSARDRNDMHPPEMVIKALSDGVESAYRALFGNSKL